MAGFFHHLREHFSDSFRKAESSVFSPSDKQAEGHFGAVMGGGLIGTAFGAFAGFLGIGAAFAASPVLGIAALASLPALGLAGYAFGYLKKDEKYQFPIVGRLKNPQTTLGLAGLFAPITAGAALGAAALFGTGVVVPLAFNLLTAPVRATIDTILDKIDASKENKTQEATFTIQADDATYRGSKLQAGLASDFSSASTHSTAENAKTFSRRRLKGYSPV